MKAMTETQRQAALGDAMRRICETVDAMLAGDPEAARLNAEAENDYYAARHATVLYRSEKLGRFVTVPE